MFTNFSDFNFEVIDVLVNNITPELTINRIECVKNLV